MMKFNILHHLLLEHPESKLKDKSSILTTSIGKRAGSRDKIILALDVIKFHNRTRR